MDFFDEAVQETPPQLTQPKVITIQQQERIDKLKVIEEERLKMIREREQMELEHKKQKKEKAKVHLDQWKQQQNEELSAKQKQNRETQEILLQARKEQNEYVLKNSWEKIVNNITLKDGEYPGKKDVSKMRQSILNKRSDLSK